MQKNISFEQIELYLTGMLNDTERIAFEQMLETDEELAADVALARDLDEALEQAPLEQALTQELEQLGIKFFSSPPADEITVQKKSNNKTLVIGLILGLLVALGGIYLWQSYTKVKTEANTSSQIFANYYQPYAADIATRGNNTNELSYQEGIVSYKQGNYEAAIPAFEAAKDDVIAAILLGNSYLSTTPSQTEKAITLFREVASDNSHIFVETAEWHLGLALLKADKREEARTVFQKMADKERGKYPKLAKQLLEEL